MQRRKTAAHRNLENLQTFSLAGCVWSSVDVYAVEVPQVVFISVRSVPMNSRRRLVHDVIPMPASFEASQKQIARHKMAALTAVF